MRCAMMQPTYLPWLGYFEFMRADVFVIYDHVQFEKASWQQRNRIRHGGAEHFLTVPVAHTGTPERISDVRIDHSRNPLRKHVKSLQQAYRRAPRFAEIYPQLEEVYRKRHEFLMDLNLDLIRLGMKWFGLKPKLLFSSALGVRGNKVEALVDAFWKLKEGHGVTEYYFPRGSKAYINENDLLAKNGIPVRYQTYQPPVYRQLDHPDFIGHLAFVDFAFNTNAAPF